MNSSFAISLLNNYNKIVYSDQCEQDFDIDSNHFYNDF